MNADLLYSHMVAMMGACETLKLTVLTCSAHICVNDSRLYGLRNISNHVNMRPAWLCNYNFIWDTHAVQFLQTHFGLNMG